MQHQPTPVVDVLENLCGILDVVGDERLNSPLRCTHFRLQRALSQSDNVSDAELCTELSESLADVLAELRLMSSDRLDQPFVRLWVG